MHAICRPRTDRKPWDPNALLVLGGFVAPLFPPRCCVCKARTRHGGSEWLHRYSSSGGSEKDGIGWKGGNMCRRMHMVGLGCDFLLACLQFVLRRVPDCTRRLLVWSRLCALCCCFQNLKKNRKTASKKNTLSLMLHSPATVVLHRHAGADAVVIARLKNWVRREESHAGTTIRRLCFCSACKVKAKAEVTYWGASWSLCASGFCTRTNLLNWQRRNLAHSKCGTPSFPNPFLWAFFPECEVNPSHY